MSIDNKGKNSVNTATSRAAENKPSSGSRGGSSKVTNARNDTATKVANTLNKN